MEIVSLRLLPPASRITRSSLPFSFGLGALFWASQVKLSLTSLAYPALVVSVKFTIVPLTAVRVSVSVGFLSHGSLVKASVAACSVVAREESPAAREEPPATLIGAASSSSESPDETPAAITNAKQKAVIFFQLISILPHNHPDSAGMRPSCTLHFCIRPEHRKTVPCFPAAGKPADAPGSPLAIGSEARPLGAAFCGKNHRRLETGQKAAFKPSDYTLHYTFRPPAAKHKSGREVFLSSCAVPCLF